MGIILRISAKMTTPDLLKIAVFWNKLYDVIIPVDDITNKNFITWFKLYCRCGNVLKFGNSSISMREVISQPQFYKDLTRKTAFFEGWPWCKFNNLGLALGTNLKCYISVAKGVKLKVRIFWRLIPTFVEVTGEKPVGERAFCPSPPPNPE